MANRKIEAIMDVLKETATEIRGAPAVGARYYPREKLLELSAEWAGGEYSFRLRFSESDLEATHGETLACFAAQAGKHLIAERAAALETGAAAGRKKRRRRGKGGR